MFVYTWKTPLGVPFYVGMGKNIRRASPKTRGHRNADCLKMLSDIGPDAVIVEIVFVDTEQEAKDLERKLIAKYGRQKDGSGCLTNRDKGGAFHKAGPDTLLKLKDLWQDSTHRKKTINARTGKKRDIAPSTRAVLSENAKRNPAMRGWDQRNGKDPEFDAKRIAGIRAAQPKRKEKMVDPTALAQRKTRLKETLNSEEFKAKRGEWDTPEYRAKLSEARKQYWARKRAERAAA
jgi:hypothetical protein